MVMYECKKLCSMVFFWSAAFLVQHEQKKICMSFIVRATTCANYIVYPNDVMTAILKEQKRETLNINGIFVLTWILKIKESIKNELLIS